MISLPPLASKSKPSAAVCGTADQIDRRPAWAAERRVDLRERVRRAAVDRGERARLERRVAALSRRCRRRPRPCRPSPSGSSMHISPSPPAPITSTGSSLMTEPELLQRRIGRDARAGVGRDRDGIEPVERQEIFRIRHDDLVGIAAVAMNAEAARLHAEVLVARRGRPGIRRSRSRDRQAPSRRLCGP